MNSNVRPGKTLNIVLDDALCACDNWEIRLDKFEYPTLESAATLYPIGTNERSGTNMISCSALRDHYHSHFGIYGVSDPIEVDESERVISHPIALVSDDDEDDHWGDEYLEGDDDVDITDRTYQQPTPEEHDAWKLTILSLFERRFQMLQEATNKR